MCPPCRVSRARCALRLEPWLSVCRALSGSVGALSGLCRGSVGALSVDNCRAPLSASVGLCRPILTGTTLVLCRPLSVCRDSVGLSVCRSVDLSSGCRSVSVIQQHPGIAPVCSRTLHLAQFLHKHWLDSCSTAVRLCRRKAKCRQVQWCRNFKRKYLLSRAL